MIPSTYKLKYGATHCFWAFLFNDIYSVFSGSDTDFFQRESFVMKYFHISDGFLFCIFSYLNFSL